MKSVYEQHGTVLISTYIVEMPDGTGTEKIDAIGYPGNAIFAKGICGILRA
jgi:hypothetical protein